MNTNLSRLERLIKIQSNPNASGLNVVPRLEPVEMYYYFDW